MVSLARSNVAQVRDPKPAQTNSHWAQKRSPGVLAVALRVSNWGKENRVSLWVRIYFQYAQYTCIYTYTEVEDKGCSIGIKKYIGLTPSTFQLVMKIAYQPPFRTRQDLPYYFRPQKHVAVAPAKHCNSGK